SRTVGGTTPAHVVRLPESSPRARSGASRAQSASAWSSSSSSSPPAVSDSGSTSPSASQTPERTSQRNAAVLRLGVLLTDGPIEPRPDPSTGVTRVATNLKPTRTGSAPAPSRGPPSSGMALAPFLQVLQAATVGLEAQVQKKPGPDVRKDPNAKQR